MVKVQKKTCFSKLSVSATGIVALSAGATSLIDCKSSEVEHEVERMIHMADTDNDGTHILNSIIHD